MNLNKNIQDTFHLINRARTHPRQLADKYNEHKSEYNDKIFRNSVKTREGVQALNDLLSQLVYRQPISHQLKWNYGLHIIADQKANLLGEKGLLTTQSSQYHLPLIDRTKHYAKIRGKITQLYQFGGQNGEDIVQWLLIDDGLASRKRRLTLLDPIYHHIGIGSALHKYYGVVTVIILAQDALSLVAASENGTILKRQAKTQGLVKQIVFQQTKLNENDKRQKLELGYSLINNSNFLLQNSITSSTGNPMKVLRNRNNVLIN